MSIISSKHTGQLVCLVLSLVLAGCGGADPSGRGGGSGPNPLSGTWGGDTSCGRWYATISTRGELYVEGWGNGSINNLGIWSIAGLSGRMAPRAGKPEVADLYGDCTGILLKKVAK